MNLNNNGVSEKPKKFSISIALYVAASIVALIGMALLIDNVYVFKTTIDQYVAQGYPVSTVMKSLVPAQLLPSVFEPIALYGGIAFALLGIGIGNKKISNAFMNQTEVENYSDAAEKNIAEQNVAELENTEVIEQVEVEIV